MNPFKISVLLVFLIIGQKVLAQKIPFKSEIEAFRLDDSIHPKANGMIVFTGSSSIRIWRDLEQDFLDIPC